MGRWLVGRSAVLCRAVAYLAALLVAAPVLYHLARGSIAYLGLFEDDYFYYCIIADKLATLGRLTYDGTTLTNGFHPLWFLVVWLLRVVAGGLNGAFYVGLTALFVASMVATYELSCALSRALGASAALAPAAALLYAVPTDMVTCSGMETAVDIPLALWLLLEVSRTREVTPARAARLGFIASLAVLGRLDLGLLVVLLGLAWLAFVRPRLADAARAVAAFSAGGVLVPVYLLFNIVVFGAMLPMSALAKQLVARPGYNLWYAWNIAFYTVYGRAVGVTLVLATLATYALWRARRGVAAGEATAAAVPGPALLAAAALLAFTACFFVINGLSGWCFFGWYAYPLGPALVAALCVIGAWAAPRVPLPSRERVAAALVAVAVGVASFQGAHYFVTRGPLWSVEDNGLLAMSVDLARRVGDRKGVFAMGAIGGFVTYLLRQPVVQIEGLVTDRAMIDHIRREDDLGPVLRQYGVDYLIVSTYHAKLEKHDGCYLITQPNAEWAGKRTDKMRGELCAEPVLSFPTRLPVHAWSEFSALDTYVWDVRNAVWKPR